MFSISGCEVYFLTESDAEFFPLFGIIAFSFVACTVLHFYGTATLSLIKDEGTVNMNESPRCEWSPLTPRDVHPLINKGRHTTHDAAVGTIHEGLVTGGVLLVTGAFFANTPATSPSTGPATHAPTHAPTYAPNQRPLQLWLEAEAWCLTQVAPVTLVVLWDTLGISDLTVKKFVEPQGLVVGYVGRWAVVHLC